MRTNMKYRPTVSNACGVEMFSTMEYVSREAKSAGMTRHNTSPFGCERTVVTTWCP